MSVEPTWAAPRHTAVWAAMVPLVPRDLAHDGAHVLRVYRWAVFLAAEADADPDLTGAAALVHDLVATPKESADRAQASARSAAAALPLVQAAGYSPAEASAISEAVRTCSWSAGLAPTSAEGLALQEADRLDAIGAVGIARTTWTAQGMQDRGVDVVAWHPTDPLARAREANDRAWALDHFPVKLLTLAEELVLPSARAEGARRHARMLAYLEGLAAELAGPS